MIARAITGTFASAFAGAFVDAFGTTYTRYGTIIFQVLEVG